MNKFGPSRGELWFRLVFSIAGLAFLAVAFIVGGLPKGPAMVEIGLIGGGFFLGTTIWTLVKLFGSRD